jgi:hypothetical protein
MTRQLFEHWGPQVDQKQALPCGIILYQWQLSEEVIGFIGLSYKVTVIPGDLLIQSDRASHIN